MATSTLHADEFAQQILEKARLNHIAEPANFVARLRVEKEITPFELALGKNSVEYRFSNPDQTLILDFEGKTPRLLEKKDGNTASVPPSSYSQKIRNSSITYEDIALRFLNWPDPVYTGDETINLRKAWKLEIPAPDKYSQYKKIRVWIDQENGALMRMEGYDENGNLLRRFAVLSVQQLGDRWMLKQMRIESFDPVTKKVVTRTYLEVTGMITRVPKSR
ncbi:MAG: outer membrane lipoprotein-sorting protein [Chthoniobacterales bacterium]